MRRYQDRTSPSPSPLKKTSTTPSHRLMDRQVMARSSSPENEDEEDEETLQLRLQALEAKLKLKQMQAKKSKKSSNNSDVENEHPERSSTCTKSASKSKAEEKDRMKLGKPVPRLNAKSPVQVPVSPPRKHTASEKPKSPGRILLGIDKGLKGKNVSLRRVPEARASSQISDDPFLEEALGSRTSRSRPTHHSSSVHQQGSASRPMGFSERIAEIRQHDKEQERKARKLQSQRSTGFGIGKEALESMKTATEEEARIQAAAGKETTAKPAFSRDDILNIAKTLKSDVGYSSKTDPGRPDLSPNRYRKRFHNPNASPKFEKPTKPIERPRSPPPKSIKSQPPPGNKPISADDSLFEPFSSLHLSKRLIPHDSLTKALTEKSILLLPDILASVKAPDYSLPDSLEADYVVLATIASKSSPLSHKDRHQKRSNAPQSSTNNDVPTSSLTEATESSNNVQGKYMALTLTDLKWTLDLYLFTTAYTRFWKMTPGTVIAILNPSIMPPPPHNPHNNRFSLTLNSNDDTILEIGTSRDLGWCSSVKRDGKQCEGWIDKRHTSVCEFHVDRVVEKTRRGRMEVNGMSAPFAPGGKRGGRMGFWGGSGSGGRANGNRKGKEYEAGGGRGLLPEGKQYDRLNKATFYIGGPTTTSGRTAANLLDANDDLTDRAGREERVRKRMAERERERDIARKLGERGNGIGQEYLKAKASPRSCEAGAATQVPAQSQEPIDAASLGLLGNRAERVLLSPLKKHKKRQGEKQGYDDGRVRKKTRFVTEKGIKEAGRESLGMVSERGGGVVEDEDELDIV
ncbi:MAG: hypothetical protein Q9181_004639 [Wetmoreana brouardii]